MEEIKYDDFAKIEMKVGLVKSASEVEKSDKLLKLIVDFGSEEKQVLSGIKRWYSPEDVLGKKFVFITNLEGRKIMGMESEAMILAAEDDEENVVLVQPEKDILPGSQIR